MLAPCWIGLGDRGEQRPGVVVTWMGEHLVGLAVFDDLAVLHDRNPVGQEFDPALTPTDPWDGDVPDPWSGGEDGFIEVYDLIEAACRGLLVHIQENQLP